MKKSYSSNIPELLYRSSIACATATALFALTLGGIQIAGAETEASEDAQVNVTTGTPMAPRLRPNVRAEVEQVRNAAVRDQRDEKDQRDEREAGTSTRKDIIRTTQGIIKDIRQDNMMMRASTTLAFRENRASTTAAMKAKKADLLKQFATLKGEKKQQLSAEKKQRVDQIMGEAYRGLGAQIERLTKVDATLAAKITQASASGADMAKASSLLVTAQTAFTKARVDYEATASLSREQTGSSTSAAILKSLVKTAETSIKAAAKAYKNVADEIKPYLVPAGVQASSTTSVKASTTTSL